MLRHINDAAHDPDAWEHGLTPQQVRDVNGWLASDGAGYKGYRDPETGVTYADRSKVNNGHFPQVPDDALDRLRDNHPGLFDSSSGEMTTPPPTAPTPPAGQPPTPMVSTDEQNQGRAAEAAKQLEDKLKSRNDASVDADRKLAEAVLRAHASSAQGAKKLNAIQAEIESAVKAQTALDTPLGAREFSRFLANKLKDISDVVQSSALDAQSQNEVLAGLAEFYSTRSDNPDGAQPGAPPGAQPAAPGAPPPVPPAGPGGEYRPPADDSGALGDLGELGLGDGLGGLGPAGGLGPLAQIPGVLGGMPAAWGGLGAGIPSGLGSMLAGGGLGPGLSGGLFDKLKPDTHDRHDDELESDVLDPLGLNAPPEPGGPEVEHPGDQHNGTPAEPQPPGAAAPNPAPPPPAPITTTGPTPVTVRDGTTVTADNSQLAGVLEDIDAGKPPPDAYRAHNITLPPPGTTPPTVLDDPSKLRPLDYGTYTDGRMAVAINPQKVFIDGQIQPIEAAAGPGFLGWQHPPAPTAITGAPVPAAPAPVQPTTPLITH